MNDCIKLALELFMVLATIIAAMTFVCRLAWCFWYYVRASRNPIGKTVLTSVAALWLICAGLLAII